MNIFQSQGIDSIPLVVNNKNKSDSILVDLNLPVIRTEKLGLNVSLGAGLCINCNNNSHCTWQHSNKMHCEHYQ